MKILVVVDMQNDFIDGPLGTPEAVRARDYLVQWMRSNLTDRDFVIFTRDTHFDNYLNTKEGINLPVEHCIHKTHGWQISESITRIADDIHFASETIDKFTFGTFNIQSSIEEFIDCDLEADETVEEIIFCGLCTDICVVSNVLILKAAMPEENISVLAPACAGVTPEKHKAALSVMESCQIKILEG